MRGVTCSKPKACTWNWIPKLREEGRLCGSRKGLKTIPSVLALLSQKNLCKQQESKAISCWLTINKLVQLNSKITKPLNIFSNISGLHSRCCLCRFYTQQYWDKRDIARKLFLKMPLSPALSASCGIQTHAFCWTYPSVSNLNIS